MLQKILLIEDQLDFQLMVQALLGQRYDLVLAPSAGDALLVAKNDRIDQIVTILSQNFTRFVICSSCAHAFSK